MKSSLWKFSRNFGKRLFNPGAQAGWLCVFIVACSNSDIDKEPAKDDGTSAMDATIVLDAHAHIGSCAMWQATEPSSQCTGEVVSTIECNPGALNLVTTAADYDDEYSDVSGSYVGQIFSMAYQWSSPTTLGADNYNASDLEYANVRCENDYAYSQTSQSGGALLAFCSVDPKRDYAISEIDRCVDDLGIVGLKMHFSSSQVDVTDEQTAEWVRDVLLHAASRGLPVVIHFGDLEILCGTCDGQDPTDQNKQGMQDAMTVMLEKILPEVSELHLTFAHLTGVGAFPDWTQKTFQMLIDAYQPGGSLRNNNLDLYVDLAAVFNPNASVCNADGTVCQIPGVTSDDLATMGQMLDQWGYDRVFWGSDLDTDSFADTVDMWPGTSDEFNVVASASGADFRDTTP